MRKKFYLIGALVFALAVSGGTYAYTYTTAPVATSGTAAKGDIATVESAAYQPRWDIVLERLQLKQQLLQLQNQLENPELDQSQKEALVLQIRELQLLLVPEVPAGGLFEVDVNKHYTGYLLVKVYLINPLALSLAYQDLNMELTLTGSVDGVQVLTLDNWKATFNLAGGAGMSHTLKLIGGSYSLISDDPDEWGEGWSVTPEFYCEFTQR